MKTRAKKAAERQKFLDKLNKIPSKFKRTGKSMKKLKRLKTVPPLIVKLRETRHENSPNPIASPMDDDLSALIKQERLDDDDTQNQGSESPKFCLSLVPF